MRMALIQGMENANKTSSPFRGRGNGGFLEGMEDEIHMSWSGRVVTSRVGIRYWAREALLPRVTVLEKTPLSVEMARALVGRVPRHLQRPFGSKVSRELPVHTSSLITDSRLQKLGH